MNEALRDWVANVDDTFYIIGTVAGPHPYPAMVRDFQSVIGSETRAQMHASRGPPARHAGRVRSAAARTRWACSTRSSTIRRCAMIGVEAAGHGSTTGKHAASLTGGRPGVLHGNRTYLLQDDGRADHRGAFDLGRPRLSRHRARACLAARHRAASSTSRSPTTRRSRRSSCCSKLEGIIPALEPAHALGAGDEAARRRCRKDHLIVMNLCGRGDKDVFTVADALGGQAVSRRSTARFAALRREGRAALVTFVMARRPRLRRPRWRSSTAACRRPAPT